jgi:hypothetical protein
VSHGGKALQSQVRNIWKFLYHLSKAVCKRHLIYYGSHQITTGMIIIASYFWSLQFSTEPKWQPSAQSKIDMHNKSIVQAILYQLKCMLVTWKDYMIRATYTKRYASYCYCMAPGRLSETMWNTKHIKNSQAPSHPQP